MSQQQIKAANQSTKQHQVEHPSEFVMLSSGRSVWDGTLLQVVLESRV